MNAALKSLLYKIQTTEKTFYKQKSTTILDQFGLEIICVHMWIHNLSLVYTYIHMY